jgi:hypothetical protein
MGMKTTKKEVSLGAHSVKASEDMLCNLDNCGGTLRPITWRSDFRLICYDCNAEYNGETLEFIGVAWDGDYGDLHDA